MLGGQKTTAAEINKLAEKLRELIKVLKNEKEFKEKQVRELYDSFNRFAPF